MSGRRAEAVAALDHLGGALDPTGAGSLVAVCEADPPVAAIVAADSYVGFWAAIQTDRHDLAMRFADAMRDFADPADPATAFDRLTTMTEKDFAGLRSLSPDGRAPEDLRFSHAAALVLLEDDDIREALRHGHAVANRAHTPPTRSAADALLLLAQALTAPDSLTVARVRAPLTLSRSSWDDGRPSTFISFAAVVAMLALGRTAEARSLAADAGGPDWFSLAARALADLASERPEAALTAADRSARHTAFPRLRVLSGVIGCAALVGLGQTDAAASRLSSVWRDCPAPRLLRFALRFIGGDEVSALLTGALPAAARPVLEASLRDARPFGGRLYRPTPAEREILALLQAGRSNADIARLRDVSANTTRTQLRTLYRRLGVTDRVAAVAHAERHGFLRTEI